MIGPRPEAVAEAEGKIKTADALVAFSRAHLDYHTIRSPIDGVLDSLTCHPGQTIAIGSADRRGGRHAAGLRVRLAAHIGGRRCASARPLGSSPRIPAITRQSTRTRPRQTG